MQKNYESYNLEQFLDDPFFIQWVKGESTEADTFWNDWMKKKPDNLEEMIAAEKQLRAILSAKRIKAQRGDVQEVWERIESSLLKASPSKVRKIPQRWWAAAAILLLVASGSYFFLNRQHPKTEVVIIKKNIVINDVAPGGNKAILTLGDGSTIILDSAQNGTLSNQGNIKIIKLDDGQLAYDKSGVSANADILYNTISTPKGGQYQLTLSDGSKVWLNAASSLTFPASFSGNERKVELTGEGYFEVAHNAGKPFIVTKNSVEIRVLGTHFNVDAYDDESSMKVTLLEGSVKVSKGNESTVIFPGQQARINNLEKKIDVKKNVDLDEVIAWKNGLFQFDQANIKTIMRQISRWYDVDVVFEEGVPDKKFDGKIYRNVNASEVFRILEEGGIHIRIEGKKVIVSP